MAITTSGTTLTFNDATAQTTAPVNTNANVNSVSAGTGISVSATTGALTVTNSGVTSAVAGTNITVSGSTGAVTITASSYPLTSGTAVASTSGTSIDFTGIPSWVKRITVMFNGVSTNGTSDRIVRIGAGSIDTTGYVGVSASYWTGGNTAVASQTNGFWINAANLSYAAGAESGIITLCLIGSNTWTVGSTTSSIGGATVAHSSCMGGYKSLSGALDRIRITTVNGTDTFDAGTINILYE